MLIGATVNKWYPYCLFDAEITVHAGLYATQNETEIKFKANELNKSSFLILVTFIHMNKAHRH